MATKKAQPRRAQRSIERREIYTKVSSLMELAYTSGILGWNDTQFAEAMLELFPEHYGEPPPDVVAGIQRRRAEVDRERAAVRDAAMEAALDDD